MINNLRFLTQFNFTALNLYGGIEQFTLPFDNERVRIVFNKQGSHDTIHNKFPFAIMLRNPVGQWLPVEYGYITLLDQIGLINIWFGNDFMQGVAETSSIVETIYNRALYHRDFALELEAKLA